MFKSEARLAMEQAQRDFDASKQSISQAERTLYDAKRRFAIASFDPEGLWMATSQSDYSSKELGVFQGNFFEIVKALSKPGETLYIQRLQLQQLPMCDNQPEKTKVVVKDPSIEDVVNVFTRTNMAHVLDATKPSNVLEVGLAGDDKSFYTAQIIWRK